MLPDEAAAVHSRSCYDKVDSDDAKTMNERMYSKTNDSVRERHLTKKGSDEATSENNDDVHRVEEESKLMFGQPLIWLNIISIGIFHVISLYALFTFPYIQRIKTSLWVIVVSYAACFGVGAGVHRLWTHRSYKAKTPLRIILLFCYCIAGMNSIYDWVRDHRVHHKFSETDADPHNSNRGFFFSHVGWLMMKKHPEVKRKGRTIDMSDITSDPVIAFGEKYFIVLKSLFCFILPIVVPVYFWNEDWYYAIMSQIFLRYPYVLNATWSVNSVAHMFGGRPYDKAIAPVESRIISMASGGEGWHNYHHSFPWDYKASEMGHSCDASTFFIQTFAKIGWAYDLKEPSPDLVKALVANKGDGTHQHVEVPPPADEAN